MTKLDDVCDHCGKDFGEHLVPDSRCPAPDATSHFFIAAYHPPMQSPYISDDGARRDRGC